MCRQWIAAEFKLQLSEEEEVTDCVNGLLETYLLLAGDQA